MMNSSSLRSSRIRVATALCLPALLALFTLCGCAGSKDPSGPGSGGSGPLGAYPITAWGDSLTQGNEDGTGITYPKQLAALTGQTVTNRGIGSQTSSQIAVRMNAYSGQQEQTFTAGFTIPTSGTVNLTFQPGFEPCFNVRDKSIYSGGGVPIQFTVGGQTWSGLCQDNGSHAYVFTPATYPASAVTVPDNTPWTVDEDIATLNSGCVVIWAGRNNYANATQVQADIAAMVAVARQSTTCYLVLSVPNGAYFSELKGTANYNTLLALNSALSATYSPGNHYFDIRTALIALYNPSNPADVLDHQNDVWPYSLRAQDVSGSLTSPIASLTTCDFSTAPALTTGQVMSVAAEMIQIAGGANGAYTCTRGYAGSVAQTYPGATAFSAVDALHLGQNPQSVTNPKYTNGYDAVAALVYAWLQTNGPK